MVREYEIETTNNNHQIMGKLDYLLHSRRMRTQPDPDPQMEPMPAQTAFIYKSEMDYVSRCILDRPDIETGGQLFGFLTEHGAPVVCYAIGPGPRANHQVAFFNQDTAYLQDTFNAIRKYGLRYIGEWHSHHQMGLAKPSGHDASTVEKGMRRHHFTHFLLCIGNCDWEMHSTLNAFTFHSEAARYHHAPWEVIGMESPYRGIIDSELGDALCDPATTEPCHGANFIRNGNGGATALTTPDYDDGYWLNTKANNIALKEIIEHLSAHHGDGTTVRPMIDTQNMAHLFIQNGNKTTEVFFDRRFPAEPPVIFVPEGTQVNDSAQWRYDGHVFDSFVRYYHDLLLDNNTNITEK